MLEYYQHLALLPAYVEHSPKSIGAWMNILWRQSTQAAQQTTGGKNDEQLKRPGTQVTGPPRAKLAVQQRQEDHPAVAVEEDELDQGMPHLQLDELTLDA